MEIAPKTKAEWEVLLHRFLVVVLLALTSVATEWGTRKSLGKEEATEGRYIELEAHRQTILYYEAKLAACEIEPD